MRNCYSVPLIQRGVCAGFCLLFPLVLLATSSVPAQATPSSDPQTARKRAASLDALTANIKSHGPVEIRTALTHDGYVRFLGASQKATFSTTSLGTVQERARSFVLDNRILFTEESPGLDFQVTRTTSHGTVSYVRMQQFYSGLPIFSAESIVQFSGEDAIACVFADIKHDLDDLDSGKTPLSPILSAEQARARAVALATSPMRSPSTEPRNRAEFSAPVPRVFPGTGHASLSFEAGPATLVIFAPEVVGITGKSRLAWQMDIIAADHPEIAERVLIDARTGESVFHYPLVATALNRSIYDANNTTSDPGTLVRSEGGSPVALADANLAYDYFGHTYNFYAGEHGRNGIDGAGMPISGTVRYCSPDEPCPYENAFWSDSTERMYFGEGYASADDVVAHELTHGVTSHESNLIYFNESGAMNESFSDMWGEWIDQGNGAGLDGTAYDWLMGEDLPIGAIRNMADPPEYNDPDRMGSPLYSANIADEGGVHYNSGIGNKLCYLLTAGGTFNGRSVAALGASRTADLFYECQANLLTSASDYSDLYELLRQAAVNLSYTQQESNNLVEACLAVELGVQPVRKAVLSYNATWALPMFTGYQDSRTQSIYLASEIGRSGRITGLSLYVDTVPGQTLNSWTIRLRTTSASAFSTASFEAPAGWTTCYQGNVTVSARGQASFLFSTPFNYDGTSNLMVDFSHNNNSYSSSGICLASVTPDDRTVIGAADSHATYPDPLLWTGTSLPNTPNKQPYYPMRELSVAVPSIALSFSAPSAVVTEVTSPIPNGAYTVGQVIDLNVAFSASVTVTGVPRLELETGTINRYAMYIGGSGTDILTFRYIVQAGDSTSDLDYTNGGALQLVGGSIKDSNTLTEAILTLPTPASTHSLGANKNIVIDTARPVITMCAPDPGPLSLDGNCSATLPDLTGNVVAVDNIGISSITQDPAPASLVTSDTPVMFTVSDAAGNTANCTVTVTVIDDTAPEITSCFPDPGPLALDGDCSVLLPDLTGSVIVVDNCSTPAILQTPPAGTRITENTLVMITAADDSGNSTTCENTVTVAPCVEGEGEPCLNIVTYVYLEGAAIEAGGGSAYTLPMRTDLNLLRVLPGQTYEDPFLGTVYTPPGQPYSAAPWLYAGSEGDTFDSAGDPANGQAGYPPTVVDWVLVSLRETADGAGGPVCQAAALLHNDGTVEFPGGGFTCCAPDMDGPYYLVIEHHNHLIIMSHEPVSVIDNTLTYDFRTQQSYVDDPFGFGLFARQKEILPGIFAMFGGNGAQTADINEDTDVTGNDRGLWELQNGIFAHYNAADYILNGDINANDRILWEMNNGKYTSVPRD